MTTHTHTVRENTKYLFGNLKTYISLAKQKQIDEHANTIGKWINDVNGQNNDEALEFIYRYIHHLNNNTKKSMHEHLLNITETSLIDINKKNDLMLINQ